MTIEVPTPSAELISQLETAVIQTGQDEVAAITAIREKFTPYAKHNGFIKIGSFHKSDGANYTIDREAFYERAGRRLQGLLAVDLFAEEHTDQNRGIKTGHRLYLIETGEWLELERVGCWTRWQGEPTYWYTDGDSMEALELDEGRPPSGGHLRIMTDTEAGAEYSLEDILEELGKSMAEMCKKLPERYNRVKARAELARRTVEALR
jgi:hypothetical protein